MVCKQRLTFACEATFWLFVIAAISAPHLTAAPTATTNRLPPQASPSWLEAASQPWTKLLTPQVIAPTTDD